MKTLSKNGFFEAVADLHEGELIEVTYRRPDEGRLISTEPFYFSSVEGDKLKVNGRYQHIHLDGEPRHFMQDSELIERSEIYEIRRPIREAMASDVNVAGMGRRQKQYG